MGVDPAVGGVAGEHGQHPLGLAGLWGAQLMWMTMRAGVNARRWQSRRWVTPEAEAAGSTPAVTG